MFESITISTQNKYDINNPLDIGSLVECMLFYEKTTVIANRGILEQIIKYFGVERLLLLIEEDLLNIIYTETMLGVVTNTINGVSYHGTTELSSPQHTYQDELRKICISVAGKDGKGRRLAQRIQDKIYVTKHDQIILEGANKSILDQNYVQSAVQTVIKEVTPEFGDISKILFHTQMTSNGIEVGTNINFTLLNELYHRRVSIKHSTITPALIFSHLLEMEKELYFASTNLSELSSSNLSAKLAEQKIDYVITRSARSSDALTHFKAFLFKDAMAIRESINSNRIELDELISILQKSKKFKEWVSHVTPDKDLIKTYYEEVTRGSISDKLPTKTVRWAIFTGLGIAADAITTGGLGTATGIAIGALDTFYVDKLLSGWKPNQFIDEEVKKIIL